MENEKQRLVAFARDILEVAAKHICAMTEDGDDHDTYVFNEGIEAAATAILSVEDILGRIAKIRKRDFGLQNET